MRNSILIIIALLINIPSFLKATEPDDRTKTLANYIEASVENGNPSYINSLFDFNYFSHLVLCSDRNFIDFNKRFEQEIIKLLDPGNIVLEQITKGTYKFISSHYKNDFIVLTYRAYNETGLDYHEYYLSNIKGEFKIVDIYLYYDDILLSEHVGRLYEVLSQNYLPELFNKEIIADSKRRLIAEQKLLNYILKEDYKKAVKRWHQYNDNIKSDRSIMSIALRASSYIDTKEMQKMYTSINSIHSNTNGTNLIVLEGLFEQKEYNLTLEYIDKLDNAVNNDPYLNYLRASVYKTLNKPLKAEWFLNKFIEELPQDQSGYFSLLELYLETSNFGNATMLLDKLTDIFGFYKEELKPILAEYPNYISSDEYAQWAKE